MDRESLEKWLRDGVSVERIAARVGKSPSTVAYWLRKYDLVAPQRQKYAPKGGIEREVLSELIEGGLTLAEIAAIVGLSKTAVRHWCKRYGMRTRNKVGPRMSRVAREGKAAGKAEVQFTCIRHGLTTYVLEGRGYYRCKRCRNEGVSGRRRRLKIQLVAEAGGCCVICGYSRSMAALEFHHLDPAKKRLNVSADGVTLGIDVLRAEAAKCVLLCSNCHAEVESGVTALPVECLAAAVTAAPKPIH